MNYYYTNKKLGVAVMANLYVCIGSACYVKGSEKIVERLQYHIAQKKLDAEVLLKGSFCLEHCKNGVTVKIGTETFTNLNPLNIDERFELELLPYMRQINLEGNNE